MPFKKLKQTKSSFMFWVQNSVRTCKQLFTLPLINFKLDDIAALSAVETPDFLDSRPSPLSFFPFLSDKEIWRQGRRAEERLEEAGARYQGHEMTLRSLDHSVIDLALVTGGECTVEFSVHKNHFREMHFQCKLWIWLIGGTFHETLDQSGRE